MTATPDSFSMDELKSLLENAPSDVTDIVASEPKADGPYAGMTKEEVIELAENTVAELHEKCSHPIVQKVVVDIIIRAMLGWHSESGMTEGQNGDHKSALFWSRDAGKFQAVMCILDTIGVCDDDFTVTV
jgi:hypothetical protein